MTHFLVTGASGLLGLNFSLAVDGKHHQVTGVDNSNPLRWVNFKTLQADLTEPGIVSKLLDTIKPEVILHCAAMANLEDCEKRPNDAERVNHILPGELALAAKSRGIKLVHISTDAVFDGQKGNYLETDTPEPISVYARTKLSGEQIVLDSNPDALVLRVNFYGWSISGKRSLAEWFAFNLLDGKPIQGFTDILFCPMMVLDLTDIIVESVGLGLNGLYHCVGTQCMSKYDFGLALAHQFNFDPKLITPASVLDSGLSAVRSPNLTLATQKIISALGHDLPDFESGLQKFHDQFRFGFPDMIKALV
jgi:dTDP-4-dehydrorhamnose reductase